MLVKLDDPRGQYFGGKTAAPVSKIVLEAALAARDASLDRAVLASRESLVPAGEEAIGHRPSAIATAAPVETAALPLAAGRWPLADSSVAFTVPGTPPSRTAPSARAVPSVRGLSLRAAVLALHRAGFNVSVGSIGSSAAGTVPAAGAVARAGTVVRLETLP
jgi:cell division protein FtsI (penicillin-binding protein 3)